MAKLAIRGHVTRGNEVIEILKMLGGCKSGYEGYGEDCFDTTEQAALAGIEYTLDNLI